MERGSRRARCLPNIPSGSRSGTTKPTAKYDHPAAFYQQFQALNLGEAWQRVGAHVLVIRGAADEIMNRAYSEAISQIVNPR
jgi:hypothetical protein